VVVDGGGGWMGGPEVAGEFHSSQKVAGNLDVEVKNGAGDTRIIGTADSEARIDGKIRVRAGDQKRGNDLLRELQQNPPVTLTGSLLSIGELNRSRLGHANVSLDLTIYVPKNSRIRSHSGSGDQSIQDIAANITIGIGS